MLKPSTCSISFKIFMHADCMLASCYLLAAKILPKTEIELLLSKHLLYSF